MQGESQASENAIIYKHRAHFIFESMRFGRHKLPIPAAILHLLLQSINIVSQSIWVWSSPHLNGPFIFWQSMWNVERLHTARVRDSLMQLKRGEHINPGFKLHHPKSCHTGHPPPTGWAQHLWNQPRIQRRRWCLNHGAAAFQGAAFPNGLWLRTQWWVVLTGEGNLVKRPRDAEARWNSSIWIKPMSGRRSCWYNISNERENVRKSTW